MTTQPTLRSRTVIAAASAALLVLAACYAPKPESAPQALAATFAHLRGPFREASTAERGASVDAPLAPHLDARIRARIDSVIRSAYPNLITRTDESPALVGVIFDVDGNVTRHAARIGKVRGDANELLIGLGIDTLSARTTSLGVFGVKAWHTNIIYAMEGAGPAIGPPRYRSGIGSADAFSPNSPGRDHSREYGRRTDSLAHMVYPGAYEPGPDASIVVAVFASDGSVLTHAVKRLPLADVFDTPLGAKGDRISARGAEYLLGLVLPAELGHDDEIGSTVMRNAPHVVLVSAVRHQE